MIKMMAVDVGLVSRRLRFAPARSRWGWLAATALLFALLPAQVAQAGDANVGFAHLTYVCPTPLQINLTWDTAPNASFYSLQLVGPLDPTINGGVSGTYLPQFGTLEVAKGTINSASVSLGPAAIGVPLSLSWQVMVGGPKGYTGLIQVQSTAVIPVPCTQTTPTT